MIVGDRMAFLLRWTVFALFVAALWLASGAALEYLAALDAATRLESARQVFACPPSNRVTAYDPRMMDHFSDHVGSRESTQVQASQLLRAGRWRDVQWMAARDWYDATFWRHYDTFTQLGASAVICILLTLPVAWFWRHVQLEPTT